MKKKFYFDMDGVLADFDKSVRELSHLDEKPWLAIPHFFRDLEAMADINVLEELIEQGEEIYILTKVETRDTLERAIDKIIWIKKFLPMFPLERIIIVPIERSKIEFVKHPMNECTLVDDYAINLIEWKRAGGYTVKFAKRIKERPYADKQITNLKDLLKE